MPGVGRLRILRATPLSTWVALAVAVAVAVYVVTVRSRHGFAPAHDLYAYFYPKALYALASLQDGGRGLLWNPYLNCGQPFLAISQTGVLYPPYLLFLVFDPELALRAVLVVQLVVGGVGAFFLCRVLGARPLAGLSGALAFQLSNAMVGLTASSPTHSAPFSLLPLILFCFERVLRAPGLRRAGVLAFLIAVAILPGMPQTVFFIYQVLGLRLLYELATRRIERRGPLLLMVAAALLLPVPLAAVQLFPELENARASFRGLKLGAIELDPYGAWTLDELRQQLTWRVSTQPFMLVPCLLSLVGLLSRRTRRLTVFYAATAVLFGMLAMGTGSALYDLYIRLPVAGAFRMPSRFLWITGFCLAPLSALAVEAVASQASATARWRALPAAALTGLPLLVLWWFTPAGFSGVEWVAAGLVVAASCTAFLMRGVARWSGGALLAALVLQLLFGPYMLHVRLLPAAPDFYASEGAFRRLRDNLGPEDRLYLLYDKGYDFMAKSASLYRMPAVLDYEPLTTRRYAEYSVMLRTGAPMTSANTFIYSGPTLADGFSRRLLDLTAARYVITVDGMRPSVERMVPPLRLVDTVAGLSLYENSRRLPRAFYVPRLAVVSDPAALLQRLAIGDDDLRRVALVETPPPSGFVGAGEASDGGSVHFERNDPEDLLLQVDAPARGFLVLSDQFFPGWSATVNGEPVPIQRANYAFRLVEVPAGRSSVAFRYQSRSLRLGAGVSVLTAMVVVVLMLRSPRRRAAERSG